MQVAEAVKEALNLADNFRAMLEAHCDNLGEHLEPDDQALVEAWSSDLTRLRALDLSTMTPPSKPLHHDAALKASPTTEPNPEGMQVAEGVRNKVGAMIEEILGPLDLTSDTSIKLRALWKYVDALIEAMTGEAVEAWERVEAMRTTLTSASNLSLIGEE